MQGTVPKQTEKENFATVGDLLSFAINDAKQVLFASVSYQKNCILESCDIFLIQCINP